MCNNVKFVSEWFGKDRMENLRKRLCVGDLLEFDRGIFNHWAVCVCVDGPDPIIVHLQVADRSALLTRASAQVNFASGQVARVFNGSYNSTSMSPNCLKEIDSLLKSVNIASNAGMVITSLTSVRMQKAPASGRFGQRAALVSVGLSAASAASAVLFETEIGKAALKKAKKAVGLDEKVFLDVLSCVCNESKVRINNRLDAFHAPKDADEIVRVALEAYASDDAGGDYSVLDNNCEHFVNKCRYGVSDSVQVTKVVVSGVLTAAAVGTVILAGPVAVGAATLGLIYSAASSWGKNPNDKLTQFDKKWYE